MRALVISGGGSKGAFAGGIVEYLNKEYDLYIGTSTGALMVPLIASDNIKTLKESYTNTSQKDIFKVSPFKVTKSKDGLLSADMSILNIVYNVLIRRKKSLGDSSNLRKNLEKFLTQEDYDYIKKLDKNVLVCVTNSATGSPEYKSIRDFTLQDFYDWMWASTSAYPFMDTVLKDGYEYVDGGFTDPEAIQEAINMGATEIDAIVLTTENGDSSLEFIKNPIQGLSRMIDVMLKEISLSNIQIASLNAKDGDVKLNIYYTPRVLISNALIFDKETMEKWWNEGFEYAKNLNFSTYLVKGPDDKNNLVYRKV